MWRARPRLMRGSKDIGKQKKRSKTKLDREGRVEDARKWLRLGKRFRLPLMESYIAVHARADIVPALPFPGQTALLGVGTAACSYPIAAARTWKRKSGQSP